MSVADILLVAILISGLSIKTVRWLAIVQQKEYRFDRIWLFLQTKEGITELFRVVGWRDFSRTGLKRPKLTLRSIGTALLTVAVTAGLGYLALIWFGYERSMWDFLLLFAAFWVIMPVIAIFCAVVPGMMVRIYSLWLLLQAAEKIEQAHPQVIGITGSYGKTGTKMLLAHVLSQKYSVFMPPRSHNTILSISQSILNGYHNQEVAIIEYAAYKKGEIGLLASQLHPTMAILTGLTEQHLGLFGSLAQIITAKAELVKALPPGSRVYCANEAAAHIAAAVDTQQLNVTQVWRKSPVQGKLSAGKLVVQIGAKKITTEVVGMQYLDTIRTVYQVALDMGMTESEIVTALESFVPPSGFTKLLSTLSQVQILDDGGTSNPAGFEAALDLAAELPGSHKVLCTSGIVDLGERSSLIHRQLALQAKATVQEVWYVGQAGKPEFAEVFGTQMLTEQAEIMQRFEQLQSHTLLVIEGRMPAWFTKMV